VAIVTLPGSNYRVVYQRPPVSRDWSQRPDPGTPVISRQGRKRSFTLAHALPLTTRRASWGGAGPFAFMDWLRALQVPRGPEPPVPWESAPGPSVLPVLQLPDGRL
jgi:hypothetical protein